MYTDYDERPNDSDNRNIFPYDRDNVIYLLRRIKELSDNKILSRNSIINDQRLGPDRLAPSSLHKACHNPERNWTIIREDVFYILLDILHQKSNFAGYSSRHKIREIENHLYFSVSEALDMWDRTFVDIQKKMPGYFYSYRPSLRFEGGIIRGLVRFTYDESADTFNTLEFNLFHNDRRNRMRRQRFEGHLWRRKNKYLWIDQDADTNVFRINQMHTVYSEGGHVMSLEGLTSGTWAGKLCSMTAYLERIDEMDVPNAQSENRRIINLLRRCRIIPPEEIEVEVPPMVLKRIDPSRQGTLFMI